MATGHHDLLTRMQPPALRLAIKNSGVVRAIHMLALINACNLQTASELLSDRYITTA